MVLAALCFALLAPSQDNLVEIAKVTHPPIDEMSGIVKSRRYPGVYWVHNDSGDAARIFAIRADGSVIAPGAQNRKEDAGKVQAVPATFPGLTIHRAVNTDWEDIAYDGDKLYLCDTGNNGNARRDLAVYVVSEPNPYETKEATALARIPIAYADQKEFPPVGNLDFDCEAVAARGGKLYFFTKHRLAGIGLPLGETNLYVLDLKRAKTDKVNVLTKLQGVAGLGGWVTGAAISNDGKQLAILTQAPDQAVWTYSLRPGDDRLLAGKGKKTSFVGGKQCEAICWEDANTVRISNEQRDLFQLRIK